MTSDDHAGDPGGITVQPLASRLRTGKGRVSTIAAAAAGLLALCRARSKQVWLLSRSTFAALLTRSRPARPVVLIPIASFVLSYRLLHFVFAAGAYRARHP
jgi:hypothetical protein